MNEKKIGRNDPCPCGSGKKYKQCCIGKTLKKPLSFKAKVLSGQPVQQQQAAPKIDLMQRTFGNSIEAAKQEQFEKDEEKDPT